MSRLTVRPLSEVRRERVRWLWEPYLPRGKLVVLDGDPGVGKSLLTTDLAARLSRGGELPDGRSAGRPHVALLLNAEDGAADTTRPRAEAAGGDLDRIVIATPADAPLLFPDHTADLEAAIRARHVDLVVIDPVSAFLAPGAAMNLDQGVRRALTPLAAVAERTDCTILLVRHLRKSGAVRALASGLGSMGIIGVARVGLLAARHPADPALGVLAVTKANATGAVPSLAYRVTAGASGVAVVEWLGPADVAADALVRPPPGPLRPRDRAADWLGRELAAGPRPAAEVLAAAGAAGIPETTLRQAKADLGVESHRFSRRDQRAWYWYDPSAPWPPAAPFPKPHGPLELGPL